MPDSSSILDIDPSWRIGDESMGSKMKFWFKHEDQNWLYKKARPNTGEHWAEKISSEIAELITLHTHTVKIASYQGSLGCAVKSFLKEDEVLIHGNELLAGAIRNYDKDKEHGQRDHNFDNIIHAIEYRFKDSRVRGAVATMLLVT